MDDINIDVGLDPATYLAGADQLTGANSRLQQSMGGVVTTSAGVQKALSLITPSRAVLAGMGALAMAAGQAQQELSGLNATSAVTGINTGKLASGMRQLARDLPIGNTVARQVTEQFTRMGVSGAGAEKQIGELAKVTANLGGATGENVTQLGAGMTQLARATGNVNLEPKRFEKLSDSLVRVSKTSGASASDILAFSKNIAPMAQAAGIGATGIVGISGAFARLGEDGIGASTAVNKMLTDMSRSVREGGPQMKAYAEIVGTTSDEFERMFKANPAEALNKVTESLAKSGSAGPRQLEMLGLDGVRSQRALQALSASGGLRGAIAQSEAGYGSGDSAKAADAAFSGLNDSFTELQSTSEQLAQALGAPLTKPLKLFADGLKAPLSELTKVANSKIAQNLLTVAGIGVTSALAAKAVLGPLSLLGMGRQMAKSGVVRGFLGGIAIGAEDEAGSTRRSRVGAKMIERYDEGTLNIGPMGKANERAVRLGKGMGEIIKERNAENAAALLARRTARKAQVGDEAEEAEFARGARRRSMNPIRRAADTAKIYGLTGLNTYIGEVGRSYENAAEDDNFKRDPKMATPEEAREAGRKARAKFDETGSLKAATKEFHDHLVNAGRDAGSFGETLRSVRKAAVSAVNLGDAITGDAGGAGRSLAKKGAGLAKDAAGALVESIGPMQIAGIAATAAMAAWQFGGAQLDARKQEEEQYAKSDIYSRLNSYREASGRAGVTSVAVTAGTGIEAADKSKGVTQEEALQVSDEDYRLAEGSKDKKVTDYYGTNEQIGATIGSTYAKGLSPEDIQSVKLDLIRGGRTKEEAQEILGSIPTAALGVKTVAPTTTQGTYDDIDSQVKAAQQAPGGGWAGFFQGLTLEKTAGGRNDMIGDLLPDRLDFRPGGGMYISAMSDEGKEQNQQISKAIQDGFLAQSEGYKGDYAQQERLKKMDTAIRSATDSGDYEQADYLMREFQKGVMNDDKYETKTITSDELEANGGSFTRAFGKEDESFGKSLDRLLTEGGASLEEGKGIKPELKPSYQADILRAAGQSFAGGLFDNTKPTVETAAIAASMGEPESTKKLDVAVDAWIAAGDKAGMSMDEVGTAALKASNTLNSASQAFVIAKEAMAEADRVTARQNVAGPKGQAQIAGETYARTAARRDVLAAGPETSESRAELKTLEGSVQEQQDNYKAQLIQRLETQRSYQKQMYRTTRDHNTQMEYAEVDYQKQVDRTIEGYTVNRERSIDAFNRQRERAEEDYATSRKRQIRDFNIQMQQAEEDYLKARMRANRDFAINLARQIEDAAKTMYNPYDRIQTKATWDAKNLLVNMQEQNDAMTKQKDQLDQLRKMGLSDQAISQLQLGKAENAQQVNNLVSDFGQDPAMVAELNKVAKERAAAAGALYTDKSNDDLKRAKEDLHRGLGDMATDFATNMDRARATLSRNLKDQADDFKRNLNRMNKDFNISLEQAEEDLSRNLGYMEADFTTSVERQQKAFRLAMKDMAKDVADADKVVSGSMEDLNEATLAAMNGKAVNFSKLLVDHTDQVVKDVKTKVIPDLVNSLAEVGVTKADLRVNPVSMAGSNAPEHQSEHQNRAEGGMITGYSPHPKADNVKINATAGEYVQPVKAVNYYGPEFMEAVRTLAIPKEAIGKYTPKSPAGGAEDGPFFAEGGMVYQKMARWLHKNIPDATITSSYRPGAITALGNVSMHAQGKALDINASMSNFNKILGSFGSSIYQLFYAPADGRTILRGKPWRMDPVTKSGHWNHVHWAMQAFTEAMSASGLGSSGGDFGMAGGGGGSLDWAKIFKGFDKKKSWVYKVIADNVKRALMTKFAGAGGGGGATEGYNGRAGVSQWSDEVDYVLKMLGRGTGESGAVMRRIEMESGGNPRAINNWDSNARRGTPSKGLMQVIDPTFHSYRSSKLPDNIWDPKANIYAGANYAIKRYGSLSAIDPKNKPGGYDQGGYMQPGHGQHVNGTGKPEPVLTQEQWASISRLAARGGISIDKEQGRGIASGVSHITVTNHYTYDNRNDFSDAEITVVSSDPDEMARKLERKVVTSRVNQTRGVRRNT